MNQPPASDPLPPFTFEVLPDRAGWRAIACTKFGMLSATGQTIHEARAALEKQIRDRLSAD